METTSLFGSLVFNDKVMKERLPEDIYDEWKRCIDEDVSPDIKVADVVAKAMKEWALEHGVTHYTHWFQPMTGITAEKHDSFITPDSEGGITMEFSGKELIKGESDASSFPSGGLRATFEARGYTAWDPTGYAFIKDGILCIPTAFFSYNGQALDMKTPLLRSMESINKQALRIVKLFGNDDVNKVITTAGPEQEYFLIDKAKFDKRPDLIFTGRTLFGAKPPKGQELEDHYYGAIDTRVVNYMKDLDEELWKLGVFAKTKHNEVAPCQHELAPVYCATTVATDHNQLTMEIMKKVALRHGFVCLLHEKPFDGLNGSGKHNNWSLSTDTGKNLLEPGNSPYDNVQFLLFLTSVVQAVDMHQDLLRLSVASAGNDHRLGSNEAPPSIVSMFLGDEITGILTAIAEGRKYSTRAKCDVEIGVHVLPRLSKDTTDRNRTSPFAFTGNKFEFRMPGSTFSIAGINMILNTIVADVLEGYADRLERSDDVTATTKEIIKETIQKHGRIIFNGNNYSADWVSEAESRGLLNLRSTPEALAYFSTEENVKLFEKHSVLTRTEILSRQEILTENYCKVLRIEARTMVDMAKGSIFPAVTKYILHLAKVADELDDYSVGSFADSVEKNLKKICDITVAGEKVLDTLVKNMYECESLSCVEQAAVAYRDKVVPVMKELRQAVDTLETLVPREYWPYPTYGELLFN